MIRFFSAIAVLLVASGCTMPWARHDRPPADPALPMSMSRNELVDYLNRQSGNLHAWKSNQVRMKVRMPRMPTQWLKGSMACKSPNHFHLTASNMVVHADLGANSDRCWVYVKPGSEGVLSWRHEDAHLLEQIPSGVPYIDPDWLMQVLGVTLLDADKFVVAEGPNPATRELWLASTERSPGGEVLRRVIKVDTMRGVIREHAVYNSDDRVIVRAELSNHEPFNSHLIPREVLLDFPNMDAELSLSFSQIQTNPQIASSMWVVPKVPGTDTVDLGQLVAAAQEQRQTLAGSHRPPRDSLHQASRELRTARADSQPDWSSQDEEPDWDDPAPGNSTQNTSNETRPKKKRGLFRRWW